MPVVFFLFANMVIMYAIGYADQGIFFSVADTAPVPFPAVIAITLLMGLLSGSLIWTHGRNRVVWGIVHTASAFVPFMIGFDSPYPLLMPFGVLIFFALPCALVALMAGGNQEKTTAARSSDVL